MADNWNKAGFFSGITEDYSNYHWYKGEKENPYKSCTLPKPLKAPHCGALWLRGAQLGAPLFILLYFRTGISPPQNTFKTGINAP